MLRAEICEGPSILLNGQRRTGKTGLVPAVFRRWEGTHRITTLIVDLEGAKDPADAGVRIVNRARSNANTRQRLMGDHAMPKERIERVGEFLSWIRGDSQKQRDPMRVICSGR